jgi:hypothetical protein
MKTCEKMTPIIDFSESFSQLPIKLSRYWFFSVIKNSRSKKKGEKKSLFIELMMNG